MRIESDGHSRGNPRLYRADRARAEDREEPDRLGLARADRLPQDRRPAGGGAVAAAPGAAAGSRGGVAAGGRRRPRIRSRPVAQRSSRPGRSLDRPDIVQRHLEESYVSVAVPLRGTAFARRGDRPAARRRRLREGAGRRPEPGAADEAALRLAGAASSTSTTCPASTTTGPTRTARLRIGALCRHADLERSDLLKTHAADDGRGGAADRRPASSATAARWSARCATPTRRATGPRWCWRSAAR